MKKLLVLIVFLSSISGITQLLNCGEKKLLLMGNIKFGQKTESITNYKVEAAANLAALVSEKYLLIPTVLRDSLAKLMTKDGLKPQLNIIADTMKADFILFLNISRIHNMLRVELNLVDTKNTSNRNIGEGFANIHYMQEDSSQLIDPALLKAFQRALAVAVKDSNLYANSEAPFRIFPVPTMIVGGLEYKDNPSYFPKWDLFERPIISSYDAVESIFEQAKDSPDYVVYDIPTRDTIYTIFNLYIIENHKPPSYLEIEALDNFLVRGYISGTFTKQSKNAEIEITLNEIINGKLKPIKSEKGTLEKDDLTEFRKVLKEMTKKLLEK
ncbi:MAG: hypothetical protein V1779_07150 [bacterium]